jgi:AAA+ superfamily predicted ATPase
MELSPKHISLINAELIWLEEVIVTRLQLYFKQPCSYTSIYDIPPPALEAQDSLYGQIVNHYQFSTDERLILALTLVPHLAPQILDPLLIPNTTHNRPYAEFGGIPGKGFYGFLPTIQTVLFLLAGNDLGKKLEVQQYFYKSHPFIKFKILDLGPVEKGEPNWSAKLSFSEEYHSYFITGESYEPDYNSDFPAKKIESPLSWTDLVLSSTIKKEIEKIGDWIDNQEKILRQWGFEKHLKPGYRALFYGPPGTGKSLSAVLLGKRTNMDVYRIDLSQVVSKYIGETEKNLGRVFDNAINKNWILFFDEADALFGKRTAAKDSKDRYANQETAYLLQKIEDFAGIVVLASNLKMNIDQAFSRRFQSIIYFPVPDAKQRLILWKNIFAAHPILDETVKLEALSIRYEITGGSMINVLRNCTLLAINKKNHKVSHSDVEKGIISEIAKEGKVV